MGSATARWMKNAALALLAAGIAFFLLLGIAEMAGGEVSGVQHLVEAAVVGALLALAVKRPRAAGLVLLAVCVPVGLVLVVASIVQGDAFPVLFVLPPILTGTLLLLASGPGSEPRRVHVRSGHV